MKLGYKATNNMKCRDLTYEIGKTYETNTFVICKHGLHYCDDIMNTQLYYDITQDTVFIEVDMWNKFYNFFKRNRVGCNTHHNLSIIKYPSNCFIDTNGGYYGASTKNI